MLTVPRLLHFTLLSLGLSSLAAAADYQIGFGPFVGGGQASDGSDVRHTTGYTFAIERNFYPAPQTMPHLIVAPRFEASNSFINTKNSIASSAGNGSLAATYDNRIFAAGLTIGHAVGNAKTFAQGLYLTAMAGKGYTKLSINETSEARYRQILWGGLDGNYFGGEVGAWVPLQGQFGVNIAVLSSMYQARLPDNAPTQEGELADGTALTGRADREELALGEQIALKTVAVKIGVAIGF